MNFSFRRYDRFMCRFVCMAILGLGVLIAPSVVAAQQPGGAPSATVVIAQQIETQKIRDQLEALGTLKANESVSLTASVSEKVTEIHFEDGQRVEKGTVLVEMTKNEEAAQLDEARAAVTEAQQQYDRVKPLVERKAASEALLDQRRRELDTAKARLAAVVSRMQNLVISAPFDGVLGLRNISVGSYLSAGDLVTTIVDDSIMKLDFSVPSVFLSTLTEGLVVKAKTSSYPDRVFEGTITSINNQIDPVTRSISARALLDNKDGLLKPGLLMTVELFKDEREALVVREEAIIAEGPQNFVFQIIDDEKGTRAKKTPVTTGLRLPGLVEIKDGVSVGDTIVAHGLIKLRDGALVSVKSLIKNNDDIKPLLSGSPEPKTDTETKP